MSSNEQPIAETESSDLLETNPPPPPPPSTSDLTPEPLSQPEQQSTVPSLPNPDFRLYRPPKSSGSTLRKDDLPESYFTPSTADLKAAQDSLSARTQSLVNAPFRTQAVRDGELQAKRAKYPTTTIRVRFPDRMQLEKTFPSTDKIRAVYAFVRGTLREDVKPTKFILFQAPPIRELKVSDPKVRDLSLFDLHLAPSSILHLKFEDDELNHFNVPAPLVPEVLARAEDLPIPPDPEDSKPSSSGGRKLGSSSSSSSRSGGGASGSGSGSGRTEVKMPKWLKLGKK